eukprot:INCI7073.1.p1 GENE.INCI7073.1~~INCI7073.1.p1  ORF type:complete len:382 (+),score=48.47 INCI7073.1:143-1147(+)
MPRESSRAAKRVGRHSAAAAATAAGSELSTAASTASASSAASSSASFAAAFSATTPAGGKIGKIDLADPSTLVVPYWTASVFDLYVGVASLIGIALQNVILFGRNIENYNWGLLTTLVALQIAWTGNKLLTFLKPQISPRDPVLARQLYLSLQGCLAAVAVLAIAYLWSFNAGDLTAAIVAAVAFAAFASGIVAVSSPKFQVPSVVSDPTTGAAVRVLAPYIGELALAVFVTAGAPCVFPGNPHIFVDGVNSVLCAVTVAINVAVLLALQLTSRLKNLTLKQMGLPWLLATQGVAVAIVCLWGLLGAFMRISWAIERGCISFIQRSCVVHCTHV